MFFLLTKKQQHADVLFSAQLKIPAKSAECLSGSVYFIPSRAGKGVPRVRAIMVRAAGPPLLQRHFHSVTLGARNSSASGWTCFMI